MLKLYDSLGLSGNQNLYAAIAAILVVILLVRWYWNYWLNSKIQERQAAQKVHQEELQRQQQEQRSQETQPAAQPVYVNEPVEFEEPDQAEEVKEPVA